MFVVPDAPPTELHGQPAPETYFTFLTFPVQRWGAPRPLRAGPWLMAAEPLPDFMTLSGASRSWGAALCAGSPCLSFPNVPEGEGRFRFKLKNKAASRPSALQERASVLLQPAARVSGDPPTPHLHPGLGAVVHPPRAVQVCPPPRLKPRPGQAVLSELGLPRPRPAARPQLATRSSAQLCDPCRNRIAFRSN